MEGQSLPPGIGCHLDTGGGRNGICTEMTWSTID
jgi:hypothetical protein